MNLEKRLFIFLIVSFFSRFDGLYVDTNKPEEVSEGSEISRCFSCGPLWGFVLKSRGEEKSSLDSTSALGCAFENHGIVLPCCLCMKTKSERSHIAVCSRSCSLCFSSSKYCCCCCCEVPINCHCCNKGPSLEAMNRDS